MTLLCGLLLLACAGVVSDGAQQYAIIGIVQDFARDFPAADAANSVVAPVSHPERIGGVQRSGIFVHPGSDGEATLTWRGVTVPEGPTPTFLFFAIGLREGVPWDSPTRPNGVRFLVYVNGNRLFREELAESTWHPHALDLSPWAGTKPVLVFATEAIDGRTDYDWAVWGDPLLVALKPAADAFTEKTAGVAFARVELPAPDTVILTMGESRHSHAAPAGSSWLPLEFNRLKRFGFASACGAGEIKTVWVGAWPAQP